MNMRAAPEIRRALEGQYHDPHHPGTCPFCAEERPDHGRRAVYGALAVLACLAISASAIVWAAVQLWGWP